MTIQHVTHTNDENGNPGGGVFAATGLSGFWQDGPAGLEGNYTGAMVEDLLELGISRMEFYQRGRFACESNEKVLFLLKAALDELNARSAERRARKVKGENVQ